MELENWLLLEKTHITGRPWEDSSYKMERATSPHWNSFTLQLCRHPCCWLPLPKRLTPLCLQFSQRTECPGKPGPDSDLYLTCLDHMVIKFLVSPPCPSAQTKWARSFNWRTLESWQLAMVRSEVEITQQSTSWRCFCQSSIPGDTRILTGVSAVVSPTFPVTHSWSCLPTSSEGNLVSSLGSQKPGSDPKTIQRIFSKPSCMSGNSALAFHSWVNAWPC